MAVSGDVIDNLLDEKNISLSTGCTSVVSICGYFIYGNISIASVFTESSVFPKINVLSIIIDRLPLLDKLSHETCNVE